MEETSPSRHWERVLPAPVPGLRVDISRSWRTRGTIICVHGALDRGHSFTRLSRRLGDFDVLTYDRRGYQGSRDLAGPHLDAHVADLTTLIADAHTRGPVGLFGHSYGGVVALGAALQVPRLLHTLVCYESPLPWLTPERAPSPMKEDPDEEVEYFFRRVVSDGSWMRLSEAERASRRLDGPALLDDLRTLRTGRAILDLADLKVPTRYLFGDWARKPYYELLVARVHAVNPLVSSGSLVRAGHGAHLSQPGQLAEAITSFWHDRATA
jgi:pimeloyl-ACP methyl ester carboxylesterase